MQQKIATRNLGIIDPLFLEDALAQGAYQAAAKALTSMTPDAVIKEMEISGLRGRGGAGFPTGRKWRSAITALKKEPGPAYVVCNGDEGDPGAFMDRAIMEGDPHAVLEGMLIGAYAIGANQGFLYVRAEYPIAIKQLNSCYGPGPGYGYVGRRIFWEPGLTSIFRLTAAQGPLSAGNPPPFLLPSKAGPENLGPNTFAPWNGAYGIGPPY